ncbi:MAG: hypothetical protein R3D33_11650 [Hyphomicrobiaceae bacterium]
MMLRGLPVLAAAGLVLAGCADAPVPGGGPAEVSSFLPLAAGAGTVRGSTADVYIQIARGAKGCWFGFEGPLRGTHVYAADLEPADKGGRASIVIYEATPEGQRGLKAFAVDIEPRGGEGSESAVSRQNLRVPEPLGSSMVADVDRWMTGESGCRPVEAGWEATPSAPVAGSGARLPAAKSRPKKTVPAGSAT